MLPLRPNVCIIILNKRKQIFIAERLNEAGVWQLPQGGRENLDDILADALREAEEETGAPAENFEFLLKLNATNSYEFAKIPKYANGKWRGQFQNFIVLSFKGEDQEICLDRYHQEFQNWCWCEFKDLPKTLDARRFKGYAAALEELAQKLEF